ncbi:MAG: hypothetical protein JWL70_1397 [Acidimicrobiia bacterium]|nr:hypothetical protein [Acidimicrobiia bacterium]
MLAEGSGTDDGLTSEIDTPAAHTATLPVPWGPVDDEAPIFADDRPGPDHWLAEQRLDQAIAERARTRSLSQQQREVATFAGLCVDLAEQGHEVALSTSAGHLHRGRIATVGRDVIALHTAAGVVWIRLSAIRWVRTDPTVDLLPAGDRRDSGTDFLAALVDLWAERATVNVSTEGWPEPIRGQLANVGADLATLRTSSGLVHVPVQSMSEVAAVSG